MKAEGNTSTVHQAGARRRARILGACTAAALAIGMILVSSPARASDQSWLQRINDFRRANGLGTLQIDGNTDALSQQRADANAQSGRLEHTPSLSAGVTGDWLKLGENVGVGQTEEQIWQAFLNSPPHRANLLDAAFTHVGIGETRSGTNMWVTHRFMKLNTGGGSSPSPAPAPPVVVVPAAPTPTVVVTQPAPRAATPQRSNTNTNTNTNGNSGSNGNAGGKSATNANGNGSSDGNAAGGTDGASADGGSPTAGDASAGAATPAVTATPDAAAVVDALRVLQQ